jgi:hypothetical protein
MKDLGGLLNAGLEGGMSSIYCRLHVCGVQKFDNISFAVEDAIEHVRFE